MAYLDSDWAYQASSLVDPAPPAQSTNQTYLDGDWAYSSPKLTNPATADIPNNTGYVDSVWAFQSVSLAAPGGSGSSSGPNDSSWATKTVTLSGALGSSKDSDWGFKSVSLNDPHYPILVMTESGIKRIPIQMWDGTKLRPGPTSKTNTPGTVNPTVTPNV